MIYFLIYGLFILCCIPFQFRSSDETYLDKNCTDWIRGFAILIIMIHHGVQHYDGFPFLYPFQMLGYGAVAVFLLLSGYGLELQYQKRSTYLNGFLKNKISRLYITFWCAYILLSVGALVSGFPVPLGKAIVNLLTMSILDTPTWYIKVQAILYILFFLVFRLQMNEKHKIFLLFGICSVYAVTCALLGVKQYWWFTVLWFPVGVLLAYSRPVVNHWLKHWSVPCLAVSGVILMGTVVLRFFKGNMGYALMMDIAIAVSFVLVLFSMPYLVRFLSKPVEYIGQISLELYLIHSILLTGKAGNYPLDSVLSYVLYIVLSIAGAVLVKYLTGGITKLLFSKK